MIEALTVPNEESSSKTQIRLYLIVDRSGSMKYNRKDVIEGVNIYLDNLEKDTGVEYYVTMVIFDDKILTLYENVKLNVATRLNEENYAPDGYTALWDAMGYTLEKAKEQLEGDYKAIVIVNTDGKDNESVKYKDTKKLKSLISELKSTGKWTFTYLGADIDAWGISQQMGGSQGNSFNYRKGAVRSMYISAANATSRLSTSNLMAEESFFQDEDRALYDKNASEEVNK
jgi:uncharacterized protein YegL